MGFGVSCLAANNGNLPEDLLGIDDSADREASSSANQQEESKEERKVEVPPLQEIMPHLGQGNAMGLQN